MAEADRVKPVKNSSRLSSRLYRVSVRDLQRCHIHGAILTELEGRDAAEGRDVLVLFADGLPQDVDLDVTGLLGQHLARDEVLIQRMQRAQQGDRETAGRTQASPGGNIGKADDLQVRRAHGDHAQGFADDGVLDLVHGLHYFGGGILDEVLRLEGLVERDVDVFIDGGGEDEAPVFAVVGGKVGATASQGNAQRAAGDDHAGVSR